jgi:hypothetical protein
MGTPLELIVCLALLAFGMLLPGWLLARCLPSPVPCLGAFLGSAAILFHLVLGLDALHVPLGLLSLSAGLAAVSGVLVVISLTIKRPTVPSAAPTTNHWPRGWSWLWTVPPAFALAAVALRAVVEPLSGYDNVFRWDFLARQMLRTGTLAYYPPVSAADFNRYGWGDGIPPLVPVLNLWSYLSAGATTAVATAPRVVAEAVLLGVAVFRLSRRLWGEAAGWPALAVLATSSLFLWGVALGQETGLTALTLVAMFLFIEEGALDGRRSSLFWAGLAAGAGAICRDYTLVWPLIGFGALAWHGRLRSGGWLFGLTAFAVAAPWYLRNWVHTGNPLYGHDVGGRFPSNPVLAELLRISWEFFSIRNNVGMIPFGVGALAVTAGVLLALAAWSARGKWRTDGHVLAGIAVVGALWIWNVCQAAGGWIYASRVLTPALALGAVLAGGGLARLAGRLAPVAAAGLIVVSADAARRSLYLPQDPFVNPVALGGSHWRDFGRIVADRYHHPAWRILVSEAAGKGIVVDDPSFHAIFAEQGARVIPLMSPEVNFLFDESQPLAGAIGRLRRAGIRFLILSENSPLTAQLMANHRFFQDLRRGQKPVFTFSGEEIYDLDVITP